MDTNGRLSITKVDTPEGYVSLIARSLHPPSAGVQRRDREGCERPSLAVMIVYDCYSQWLIVVLFLLFCYFLKIIMVKISNPLRDNRNWLEMGQTWGHNGPTDGAFLGHLGAEKLTHAIPYTNKHGLINNGWTPKWYKVMTIRYDVQTPAIQPNQDLSIQAFFMISVEAIRSLTWTPRKWLNSVTCVKSQ
jgi:hypothetical protein